MHDSLSLKTIQTIVYRCCECGRERLMTDMRMGKKYCKAKNKTWDRKERKERERERERERKREGRREMA